jgi:ribosomal-protein-alanine N-acetyltransferase
MSDIKLTPSSLSDYPIIQNMARFYVYDISEYMGWGIPEDGLYECIDFKKYWEDENASPFFIHYKEELAGFVIIDKRGSRPETDFNMAQFFILRKFKNKGIGRLAASVCFDQFKGHWEVMVLPENTGAYNFWKSTITHYTHNNFQEENKPIPHFDNSQRTVFYFNSTIRK